MKTLIATFSVFALLSPQPSMAAACGEIHYVFCQGAFPGSFAIAEGVMRYQKDHGNPSFHDQGACEEIGRNIGWLGGLLASSAGAPAAAALVGSSCGECLCRHIY
jgi:hypothetical protein